MPDRPIIFSGPMIKALLDGRKTQTRRILEPQPEIFETVEGPCEVALFQGLSDPLPRIQLGRVITCQQVRYAVGDRLWVRESCRAVEFADGSDAVQYLADDASRAIGGKLQAADQWLALYTYRGQYGCAVPSIHMPRWASRLTLAVTGVKVERLQDISEEDARAEGCFVGKATGRVFESVTSMRLGGNEWANARDWYADLWEQINGPDAWQANPWVVAVTFAVHRCNIDTLQGVA